MYSNDHARPFQASNSLNLSNGIRNFSIQWVLTFQLALWKFGSPSKLQLPKWESTWECVGSFPHSHIPKNVNVTPRLHSRPTPFHAPFLGHEPKTKVVTYKAYSMRQWQSSLLFQFPQRSDFKWKCSKHVLNVDAMWDWLKDDPLFATLAIHVNGKVVNIPKLHKATNPKKTWNVILFSFF
jgi:hypothetical protein